MKRHKYHVILLSYLAILLIPIVLSAFLHVYNRKLVTAQSEEMTEQMLTSIRDQTDSYMENIWKIAIGISQLNSINAVLREDSYDSKKVAYDLYCVSRDIDTYYYFDSSIKDVFVYFKGMDKIAGKCGVISPDNYAAVYLDDAITGDMLKERLESFPYKEYAKFENTKGSNDIWCLLSDPRTVRFKDAMYTVVVVFEDETLKKQLESLRWMNEIVVIIQDGEDQNLCDTGNFLSENRLSVLYGIGNTESSYQQVDFNGETYDAMVKESSKIWWKYYMMIPENVLYRNVKELQRYYFVMLFVCIGIGFWTARVLSKNHYHPIKLLSELILKFKDQSSQQDMPDANVREDSYQWLQAQVDHFFQERVNTIQLLKQNQQELKNYYLMCLLENSYTQNLEENLQKNQVVFPYSHFMVIQFLLVGKQFDAAEYTLAQFAIQNIFTELIESRMGLFVYMVHMGERIVGIINFDSKEQQEKIFQSLQEGQEFVKEKLHYEVMILSGGCYGSQTEIFKSYEDSCEAEEYTYLLDETFIRYEDICVKEMQYRYNAELDQKLFNAIKNGSAKTAKQWLHALFEQYEPESMMMDIYRYLLFDIMGTILRAAEAGGYQNAAEENHLMEQLVVKMTPAKMEKKFCEIIGHVCEQIQMMYAADDEDKTLSRMVQEFIRKNFRNPDINVSLTGQHFQMSPSYLSSLYKKQTGESLLNYLNQIRLEEAERLLEEGMSVAEVAQKAGFRDSTYLIRVFKKKNGITPGQKRPKL